MVIDVLRNRAMRRRERYCTHIVSTLPTREEINEKHIDGTLTKTTQESDRRYILAAPSIDLGDGIRESPTAIARDYLTIGKFKAGRMRGTAGDRIETLMHRSPAFPSFAEPTVSDDGYYIDIHHAFWTLMLIAGWSVRYDPGRTLTRGRPPDDFPFSEISLARNCLVSVSISRGFSAISPPDWSRQQISGFNPLLNTALNVFIRDVLHALAYDTRRVGAVYAQTDGYIAPNFRVARDVAGVIDDYGLSYSVKARGPMRVVTTATYTVGPVATKTMALRTYAHSGGAGIIEPDHRRWLAAHLQSLSAISGINNDCEKI